MKKDYIKTAYIKTYLNKDKGASTILLCSSSSDKVIQKHTFSSLDLPASYPLIAMWEQAIADTTEQQNSVYQEKLKKAINIHNCSARELPQERDQRQLQKATKLKAQSNKLQKKLAVREHKELLKRIKA